MGSGSPQQDVEVGGQSATRSDKVVDRNLVDTAVQTSEDRCPERAVVKGLAAPAGMAFEEDLLPRVIKFTDIQVAGKLIEHIRQYGAATPTPAGDKQDFSFHFGLSHIS